MWFKCRSLDFPARVLILGSPRIKFAGTHTESVAPDG